MVCMMSILLHTELRPNLQNRNPPNDQTRIDWGAVSHRAESFDIQVSRFQALKTCTYCGARTTVHNNFRCHENFHVDHLSRNGGWAKHERQKLSCLACIFWEPWVEVRFSKFDCQIWIGSRKSRTLHGTSTMSYTVTLVIESTSHADATSSPHNSIWYTFSQRVQFDPHNGGSSFARGTWTMSTSDSKSAGSRSETDSMGAIDVPNDRYYGAQTGIATSQKSIIITTTYLLLLR